MMRTAAEKIVNTLLVDLIARSRDGAKWDNRSEEEVCAEIRRDWIIIVNKCLEVDNGRSRTKLGREGQEVDKERKQGEARPHP